MTRGRVSNDAVQKATGKKWSEWFAILNKAGARDMTHTEIAHFLSTKYIPNGWWAQSVTVEYERIYRSKEDAQAESLATTWLRRTN